MYIGIDLGGTNIAVGLVNNSGEIIAQGSVPTKREREYTAIVADMATLCADLLRQNGLTTADVRAVGIGSPGTVDFATGTVVYANNLKMDHAALADEFRKHMDVPVFLENDANAAAYGEYVATGEKVNSFIFMTLGTGVGGGIVLDGKVYHGFNSAGGEIGHTSIIMDGKPCTCGRKGCLEAYASVTALISQTAEKCYQYPDSAMNAFVREHNGVITGRTAFQCAAKGDLAAIEVRDQYIRYIAEGVCNLINIFQPDIFVIGGGISKEGDTLLNPIRRFVEENDYNKYLSRTQIKIAKLFNDAGIVGAAMVAANTIGDR